MKVLLITQWFQPEVAIKGLPFAKELIKQGHSVEVLTGFPNYPGGVLYDGYKIKFYQKEIMDDIVVHRVALYPDHGKSSIKRIFNYVSFGFMSALIGTLKLSKFDVIYSYHPPLTTAISAGFISFFRRSRFVIDIQDLWPDTLAATGMLTNKKILTFIGYICSFVYRWADHIVVLSPGFKNKLLERGVPEHKVDVIYNWTDETALESFQSCEYTLPSDGFNIVFAGNLGNAQGLPALVKAAFLAHDKGLNANFVFVGDGIAKSQAISQVKSLNINNVFFIPRVPATQVGSLLRQADALLVHLVDDPLFEITIPSRTQSNLYIGKPVLMAVAGDAADLISSSNSGLTALPNNPVSILEAVEKFLSLSQIELDEMGRRSRNFYCENLSISSGTSKFIQIFDKVRK